MPSVAHRSEETSPSSQPSVGGGDAPQVKVEEGHGPPQSAPSEQATSDDFHLMWSELEAYLTKRFSGGPQSLVSLRRVLDHVKRQRLRVEELAFLIGNSFPDAPDVSLCMSLFLPDRTLIHAGNPAAAMCILIQNMAPDKYAIFNSILKSCMAQKTQRGSRDILLHRMQLLFRGHPLVIRAIRKLLVQQFCIEKNGGVIRKNQALELAKPFDDEPVQVHSVFRLAYQVGLSGGCAERARVLASNVLHLVRMFLSKRLAFSSFSDEIDRVFASFPSWFHVAGDIKQLILTVCSRDIQHGKEIERVVKLLAARNPAACSDRRAGLLHLCDLFLHGVASQSLSLRIEIDHIISRTANKEISAALALQRIAALLLRFPDCSEKLGVLIRLFEDIHIKDLTQAKPKTATAPASTANATHVKTTAEATQSIAATAADAASITSTATVEKTADSNTTDATGTAQSEAKAPSQATGALSCTEAADGFKEDQITLHQQTESTKTENAEEPSPAGLPASPSCPSGSPSPVCESVSSENAATDQQNRVLSPAELQVVRAAADLLCKCVEPSRYRSQEIMIQILSYTEVQPVYHVVDDWNAGRLSPEGVYSGLCAAAASSSWGLGPVHRLAFLLKSLKKPLRSRPLLTRQQSDKLPKNGSYRKLPEECSTATCSGRDALSWQVLNDSWGLFPDSSESQARHMNRHEEALLSLADSRYEWDMRICLLESCLKRLKAIKEAIEQYPDEERQNCTVRPSFFQQTHVSCLRRIFGSNTEQVLSSLCASPFASLSMVLSTLEAKLLQWRAMAEVLAAYWTSLEAPHYAGAVDFKKRCTDNKRGGGEIEEMRSSDGRNKYARTNKNDNA